MTRKIQIKKSEKDEQPQEKGEKHTGQLLVSSW